MFFTALRFTLKWEGGYVDDPDDPGGATNFGITQATYDAWRQKHKFALRPVEHIIPEEVSAIYEAEYWREAGCGYLPPKAAVAHFDAAVNVGPKQAIRFLQAAIGSQADGKFGSLTRKALSQIEETKLIFRMLEERREFYAQLVVRKPKLKKFLQGWNNRITALDKYLQTL